MDDAEFEALEEKLRDRAMHRRFPWAAGLLLLFFQIYNTYISSFNEMFKALRVDIPLPTRFFLGVSDLIYPVTGLLAGAAIALYITRSRLGMKLFLVAMVALTIGEGFAIYLPIVKIQEALRKK